MSGERKPWGAQAAVSRCRGMPATDLKERA